MNGFFTKLNYKVDCMSLNGVYLAFELKDARDPVYFDKVVNFATHLNIDAIAYLSEVEHCILDVYKKLHVSNAAPIYTLSDQLQNGNIKIHIHHLRQLKTPTQSEPGGLRTYEMLKGVTHIKLNKYVIKIAGVWETDNNIGITYKIMKGYSPFVRSAEMTSTHLSI